MKITFVQAGGTIDKDYPQGENHHGYEFKIGEPAFKFVIEKLRRTGLIFDTDFVFCKKKDSLDLTDQDRDDIKKCVEDIDNDKIIITHGTDTIMLTASVLDKIRDKVIVLTGASLPEKFTMSDADFNIGMSCAAVQLLPNGVYIALDGHVQPWRKFTHLNIGKGHNNFIHGHEVD